jgi:AcrR family transcriptional regulator
MPKVAAHRPDAPSLASSGLRTSAPVTDGANQSANQTANQSASHIQQVDGILQAAAEVVLEQGIANFTLDKVASRVGVSKSGLLHYFPSKDMLLSALVQRVVSEWRHELGVTIAQAPAGRTRVLHAMLNGCLADPDHWTAQMRTTSVAVIAAISNDRKHAEPVREVYAMLREAMRSDGLDEALGDFVMCAMDGLWMSWVFEMRAHSMERLEAFRACLRRVIVAHEQGVV